MGSQKVLRSIHLQLQYVPGVYVGIKNFHFENTLCLYVASKIPRTIFSFKREIVIYMRCSSLHMHYLKLHVGTT
jgi:hypothetical protein